MSVLKELQPQKVFKFFEEMCKIPHGSGNEKEISNYLVDFAKARGLEVIQDKELNVIIKKPATRGYENLPGVIIQGHMDMVCEKNKDTNHDFNKDPLNLRVVDDFLYATGTTLGADNGIAVAYGLAILDSSDIDHPALELLVTTGEETGMYGAMAVDAKELNGKVLLNIDSEEQGIFLVSCAGGVTNYVNIKNQWEKASNPGLKIEIKGLKGGHSGMEIIKQRGNANKLLGRLLNFVSKEVEFNLCYITGGAKNNAIPREAEAIIALKESDVAKAKELVSKYMDVFKNELRIQDPDINIVCEECTPEKQLTKDVSDRVVKFITLMPNGVQTMSKDIDGLVESSLNLGVIQFSEEKITFTSAVRSSVKSLKHEIVDRIEALANLVEGEMINDSDYPEWQYNPDSKIRDICLQTYKEVTGEEPKVDAIHAGLECGLLMEKMPDVDMISFGPNLFDVHTPDEHMSIKSVQIIWQFINQLLKNIR